MAERMPPHLSATWLAPATPLKYAGLEVRMIGSQLFARGAPELTAILRSSECVLEWRYTPRASEHRRKCWRLGVSWMLYVRCNHKRSHL